jgi:hypothetical protein
MIALKIDRRELDRKLAAIVKEQPKKVGKALGRTASLGINILLDRLKVGEGLKGAFKPYSESYAWDRQNIKPKAQVAFVDLNRTGKMWSSLTITKLTRSKAVISATGALDKKKIANTDKQRPWFGFKPDEEKRLVRFFGKQL